MVFIIYFKKYIENIEEEKNDSVAVFWKQLSPSEPDLNRFSHFTFQFYIP